WNPSRSSSVCRPRRGLAVSPGHTLPQLALWATDVPPARAGWLNGVIHHVHQASAARSRGLAVSPGHTFPQLALWATSMPPTAAGWLGGAIYQARTVAGNKLEADTTNWVLDLLTR
ncbi:MAG: hypothetical protein ACRD8U_02110, partial [Pyrinomonadaceae bacterium]